jgi:hypothetical protein
MSAPAKGQEEVVAEPPADGEKKQRRKKGTPKTSEEFTSMCNEIEADFTHIHKFYLNFNRHGLRTAPMSPSSKETAAPVPMVAKLARYYEYLCKPKKRQIKNKVKGFKQEKWLHASAIPFFNTAGGFDDSLKIVPEPEANGDAIFCIAHAISVIAGHVATKKLKRNPAAKTEVTFDADLKNLFAGVMGTIKRDQWTTNANGEIVTNQAAIQALIPKLFDLKVVVPESLYTEAQKERMEKRSAYLAKRTEENGKIRRQNEDAQKKADRDAKAAKKAAANAPAVAPK